LGVGQRSVYVFKNYANKRIFCQNWRYITDQIIGGSVTVHDIRPLALTPLYDVIRN